MSCPGTILYIGDNANQDSEDSNVIAWLQGLGWTVTYKYDDEATSSHCNGQKVVFISDSVDTGSIGTKFKDVHIGVVCCKGALYDDMKMCSSNGNNSNGTTIHVNSGHAIAAGYSGTTTVYTSSKARTYGTPSGNATTIAALTSGGTPAIFAYESGANMSGLSAPARRVGFFMGRSTFTSTTAAAKAMLHQAIIWASNNCVLPTVTQSCTVDTILYVCDRNDTTGNDGTTINWLVSNGYTVTIKSSSTLTVNDTTNKSLVIISDEVITGDVDIIQQNLVPMIIMKREVGYNWYLGSASGDGLSTVATIVNPPHYAAAGYTGNVTVSGGGGRMRYLTTTGINNAIRIAYVNGYTTARTFSLAYESGDAMDTGVIAPDVRCFFGMKAQDHKDGKINSAMLAMFLALIEWAKDPCCNSGYYDCFDVCDGNATEDCDGICDGTAAEDCLGICHGTAEEDCLGICDGTAVFDCAGVCDGSSLRDCSGVCGGTKLEDCAGTCDGNAFPDCSGTCNGTSVMDCNGICGGDGYINCIGTCVPQQCIPVQTFKRRSRPKVGALLEKCKNIDEEKDCAGTCYNPKTTKPPCVRDCAGVCGGKTFRDCLGVCGGKASRSSEKICVTEECYKPLVNVYHVSSGRVKKFSSKFDTLLKPYAHERRNIESKKFQGR